MGWRQVHWVNPALCFFCRAFKMRGWAYYAEQTKATRFVCETCAITFEEVTG